FGGAQQRLCRNAAPVQADAAEIITFDDRSLEAKLRRADGRDIAARTRTDDDDVEGVSHVSLRCSSGPGSSGPILFFKPRGRGLPARRWAGWKSCAGPGCAP